MSGPTIDPALYRHRDLIPIRRALVSVSDKTGLVELAQALADAGVEIVSTGGSAAAIADAGYPVTQVGEVTGYPESLDGRVRTLHPAIHSGLLADLRLESHEAQLNEQGIQPFELVVNLYPFVKAAARPDVAFDALVEEIDIGGPSMVRSAAKNFQDVLVVVDPADYEQVLAELERPSGPSIQFRFDLARKGFAHTAAYDSAVAAWFEENMGSGPEELPEHLLVAADRGETLRYGENSHQKAALYPFVGGTGIAQSEQLNGKEMSYNNYVDADAAVRAAYDFDTPAIAIIKHANPCGIATDADIAVAHAKAHACDPLSAFGGVIASNRTITVAAAESIAPIFTEVVVAPDFEPEALAILTQKKNLRVLRLPDGFERVSLELKQLSGGFLAQQADQHFADPSDWTLVAGDAAGADTLADLAFAWTAVRAVKSNAILLASGSASVGVGMGQVNRVDSCRLAVERAGDRAAGSVAASDAFFPFADGAQILLDAGVAAIVQPGGSIRDEEVIAAAKAAGVTMYFTGERHFFH